MQLLIRLIRLTNDRVSRISLLGFILFCIFFTVQLKALPLEVPWLHADYKYRIRLTNLSPVNSASGVVLTNFPLALKLTNFTALKQYGSSSGAEITFQGENGVQLFHEQESYDKTTGSMMYWVCIPYLSNNISIYMYLSNTSSSFSFNGANATASYSGTLNSLTIYPEIYTNVWDSNFAGVYHFTKSNNSIYLPFDSTGYGNHFTTINAASNVLVAVSNGSFGLAAFSTNLIPSKVGNTTTGVSTASNILFANKQSFTHSAWVMNISGLTTNWYPGAANGTNQAVYFSLKRSAGAGASEGWGNFSVNGTNAIVATMGGRGNTSNTPALQSNTWQYLALAGDSTPGSLGIGRISTYIDGSIDFASTAASTSNTNIAQRIFLFGGENTSGTARVSPLALMDEYRVSLMNRSSNWLFTENSNMQGADTNEFYFVADSIFAKISNVVSFPMPAVGSAGGFALDGASLFLPYRYNITASNYITNIQWIFSNNTLQTEVTSNVAYVSETNIYIVSNIFATSGDYIIKAKILDLSNSDMGIATLALTVSSTATIYDLSQWKFIQTNNGVTIDLFQGLDNGQATPTNIKFIRNGFTQTPSQIFPYAGATNIFHDKNYLFYDTPYTYTVILYYSQVILSNVKTISFSEPSLLTNLIYPTGPLTNRTLENFYLQINFAEKSVSEKTTFTIQKPSDVKILPSAGLLGSARNEVILGTPSGTPSRFYDTPFSMSYNLPIQNGRIFIPGYSFEKWPFLSEKEKLAFGFWTGNEWRVIPTSYTLLNTNTIITLSATFAEIGRIGLMLSTETITSDVFKIRSRMLIINSSDNNYNQILFNFRRENQEETSISIQDMNGKTIFSKSGINNNSYSWDGIGTDKKLAKPGIYIYQLKIGGTINKGSFVIVQP